MSITIQQARIYMSKRAEGHNQLTASATAGFSERTARRLEEESYQPYQHKRRHWRTRPDPLINVWESQLVPLLKETPGLMPITLLEHLQEQDPIAYPDRVLRTLERRVKKWKALHGPPQEVMFRQIHLPGILGLSDFTRLKGIVITIGGKSFSHLLYHFRLAYSGWQHIQAVVGGESFNALSQGLQEALERLGGCPQQHRTDSLSAAFKNLKKAALEDLTQQYKVLCQHYHMTPSRNNRGRAHENGGIESPHGHVKRRIKQALLKRGSTDFPTIAAYQRFLEEVVAQLNRRYAKKVIEEKTSLQPLPHVRFCDYKILSAVVSSSSTINVALTVYSVPSRLIGQRLTVHLFTDRLELYLSTHYVLTLNRVYALPGKRRARSIRYEDMIDSLLRKPRAFLYSQLRDDLLPTEGYRQLWTVALQQLFPEQASRWMVGVLGIAARTNCEKRIEIMLQDYYQKNKGLPTLAWIQRHFEKPSLKLPPLCSFVQHSLKHYDELLRGAIR